jgi:MFS family permease
MLPIYIHELGGTPVEISLVFSVFAGISIFSNLFWGAFSDFMGKRKIFIVFGMGAIAPIFFLMAYQNNIITLVLLRGITAVFKGAIVPTSWALIADVSPPEKIGRNMGLLGAVESAGFAIGPALGGLIADFFGFPILWFFVSSECLLGALIFLVLGRDPQNLEPNKQRVFSTALKNHDITHKLVALYASFAIFLLGFALLGPNLNVHLFNLGYSKTTIGMMALIGVGISTLIQPVIGSASDNYGRKLFLIIAATNLAFGNVILFFATDFPFVLVSQILISNYNIFQLIGSAYISEVIPQTEKSGALGLFGSVGSISRSLGAIIGGYMIALTSVQTLIACSVVFPILSIISIRLFLTETKTIQ